MFIGAGKLGLPDNAVVAFALGCDMVNVAREAMLAIGCIQAQKCHTDTCPTGCRHPEPVADARPRPDAQVGAAPPTTSRRCAATWSRSPRRAASSTPASSTPTSVEVLDGRTASTPLARGLRLPAGLGACPSAADQAEIIRLMTADRPAGRVGAALADRPGLSATRAAACGRGRGPSRRGGRSAPGRSSGRRSPR